jgi:hypothetical protein
VPRTPAVHRDEVFVTNDSQTCQLAGFALCLS